MTDQDDKGCGGAADLPKDPNALFALKIKLSIVNVRQAIARRGFDTEHVSNINHAIAALQKAQDDAEFKRAIQQLRQALVLAGNGDLAGCIALALAFFGACLAQGGGELCKVLFWTVLAECLGIEADFAAGKTKPIREIQDTDVYGFMDKVEALPEQPVDDTCQLIKTRVGNRWRPDCSKKGCESGMACKLTFRIIGPLITARCDCR